jgi:hypothetical protein
VLARWQDGAGRVVAWTPGVAQATAGAWAGERRLWQDATRWVARAPAVAVSGNVRRAAAGELRPRPADATPLGPLTAATGGQVLAVGDVDTLDGGWRSTRWWLALAALACFLAGVALRPLGGGDVGAARAPARAVSAPAPPAHAARRAR